MSINFNPDSWYFQSGADLTHVVSAPARAIVAVADSGYVAWLAAGNNPTVVQDQDGMTGYGQIYNYLTTRAPDVATGIAAALFAAGDLMPKDAYNYLLTQGVALTSTGTPALDGTYPIDPTFTTGELSGVYTQAATGQGFPGGGSTWDLPDLSYWTTGGASGALHTFDVTQFVNFGNAVSAMLFAYSSALKAGGTSWPSNAQTIA